MAKSGIERIDRLYYEHPQAQPIVQHDPDKEAVGFIQDLLAGHGFREMPDALSSSYGSFGNQTRKAVAEFRGIPDAPDVNVDGETLRMLVDKLATNPRACRGYLTFKLNFPWTGVLYAMSLVTLQEGRFATLNRNTDQAGLSFGVIQWAQSPKRLFGLVNAFHQKEPDLFNSTFGGNEKAQGMLAHVNKKLGGLRIINAKGETDGETADPLYDLTKPPWDGWFEDAGRSDVLQRIQVQLAQQAFRETVAIIRSYAGDRIRSQRAMAFMLDLSNQHGPHEGRFHTGAKAVYKAALAQGALTPGLEEKELMERMSKRSIEILKAKYSCKPTNTPQKNRTNKRIVEGGEARRLFFRETKYLSNQEFQEN
jgi:hypothetical protein